MRKRQDSNLRTAKGRSTVFEAASFSHSDTLPVYSIGTLSQTISIPPTPFSRGRSGPAGFPSPLCLPCPPTPARHLKMPCYFIAAFTSSTYLLSQIHGPGRSSDDDLLNPPDPVFKGAIRAYGLSIAACLPCSPTPARHLMTYLNPPNPLFKGAHQAFVRTRARGHRFAVLRPASDDALVP